MTVLPSPPTSFAWPKAQKAPKRDGDHGLLALFWQRAHNKKGTTAMILVILAIVGMALTTAFGLGLLPL